MYRGCGVRRLGMQHASTIAPNQQTPVIRVSTVKSTTRSIRSVRRIRPIRMGRKNTSTPSANMSTQNAGLLITVNSSLVAVR